MNRVLRRITGILADFLLYVGLLLAGLVAFASFLDQPATTRVFHGLVAAAAVLLWTLPISGLLRLLLSFDERLQRLEERR